jgi:hypothetical protein
MASRPKRAYDPLGELSSDILLEVAAHLCDEDLARWARECAEVLHIMPEAKVHRAQILHRVCMAAAATMSFLARVEHMLMPKTDPPYPTSRWSQAVKEIDDAAFARLHDEFLLGVLKPVETDYRTLQGYGTGVTPHLLLQGFFRALGSFKLRCSVLLVPLGVLEQRRVFDSFLRQVFRGIRPEFITDDDVEHGPMPECGVVPTWMGADAGTQATASTNAVQDSFANRAGIIYNGEVIPASVARRAWIFQHVPVPAAYAAYGRADPSFYTTWILCELNGDREMGKCLSRIPSWVDGAIYDEE